MKYLGHYVFIGLTVTVFLVQWIKRYKRMGYQPKEKPITLTTKPVEAPIIYRLDIPKGFIANQCSRCLDIYLIRIPPPFNAKPYISWLCNHCKAKTKGVYR